MVDAKNLFDAQAASLSGTMQDSHGGVAGFVVPEYQREYDWKDENVKRLLEDCLAGFASCWNAKGEDPPFTFLGTIILVKENGSKERSFNGTSLAIVDGQQRLTTLSILCCILAESLMQNRSEVKDLKRTTREWLKSELDCHRERLYGCVIGQQLASRKSPFPRITRRGDRGDTRGADHGTAYYQSVVAKLLKEFSEFFEEDRDSGFEPERNENDKESERLFRNYDLIKAQIELALVRVEEEGYSLNYDRDGKDKFEVAGIRRLFEKMDPDTSRRDTALADISAKGSVAPLVRLIAFSAYITKFVVLTRVETEERYAFDIFDALNTTGEPLTAIETFRPKVIQFEEQQSGFKGSDCEQHFSKLSRFLDDVYSRTQDRQRATKELLVTFALYLEGKKLGLSLNEQRTFLRRTFEAYGKGHDANGYRRRFVETIADLAEFRYLYWDADQITRLDSKYESAVPDAIKLSFAFMKKINTSMALPCLARYWRLWRDKQIDESEFLEVVKAMTAFIVLRRAVTGGTASIDTDLRKLMANRKEPDVTSFCVGKYFSNKRPAATILKRKLRGFLEKRIGKTEKEAWISQAHATPLAEHSAPICRFLLLAASHNARPDKGSAGLFSRHDVVPSYEVDYLIFKRWNGTLYATVEHVAPINFPKETDWDSEIYIDDVKHCLGNLVLLPQKENSSISNASWEKKRLFYRALSARTREERQAAYKEAKESGLPLSKKTTDLLNSGEHLPMLESLDSVAAWNRDQIVERSRRLLALAWDEIWPWLEEAHGKD